jgi:hypothetical protein
LDDADHAYGVVSLAKLMAVSVKPLDLNGIAQSHPLEGKKPARAVAGYFQVARLSEVRSAEQPGGTERQSARSGAFQNYLVITQARDAETRHGVCVSPGPRRALTAGLHTIFPSPVDQDAGKLGLRV